MALRQLTQVQIRVLRQFAARRGLTTPGNLGLAVQTTAILGGYLYRKNAPPPGHHTICMGWTRLTTMAELYELKDCFEPSQTTAGNERDLDCWGIGGPLLLPGR